MRAIAAFTPDDKDQLVKSWAMVKDRSEEVAGILFKKFFEQNPELKSYFSYTQEASWEEMNKDKSMKAHTIHVLYTLAMVIDNLDEIDLVLEMVRKNVGAHLRRRIKLEHYRKMKKTLLDTMEQVLGSKFTKKMEDAWSRGYNIVLELVEEMHNESLCLTSI